jgi:hypothetical protein
MRPERRRIFDAHLRPDLGCRGRVRSEPRVRAAVDRPIFDLDISTGLRGLVRHRPRLVTPSTWRSSMSSLKVGVIVGSNRRESINRKLAEALVRSVGDRMEPDFIRIDDLPMYNQDLEGNRPETVIRFTREVAAAKALLFVTRSTTGRSPRCSRTRSIGDQNRWIRTCGRARLRSSLGPRRAL